MLLSDVCLSVAYIRPNSRTVRPRKTKIVQFAITINSNVCLHIRVQNTLMRESYADVIGIFNSEARY